jgi:hypothetical protein
MKNTELVTLPGGLPSVKNATLPKMYESARTALSECYRVDECKDWADKAAALASYAKQAQDNSLYETAQKIHGRAIKRCGELLKAIEPARGANQNISAGSGSNVVEPPTRKDAAREAGLSHRQQHTALRVANIPEEEFEELIEQSPPPTVTELAERGKKPAPKPLIDLGGRSVQDFKAATHGLGVIRDFYDFAISTAPESIARGASTTERSRLLQQVPALLGWLNDLLLAVGKEKQ